MKRFRSVLLVAGLDDGPMPKRVFERALSLAQRNEADLTVIDVIREVELLREILPSEMSEAIRRDRHRSLNRLMRSARDQGVEIETELVVGRPFEEVVRRVTEFGHDLVMTDGGHRAGGGWAIDSPTMHLMRKCPCAIWVVCPQTTERYRKVLAAIDPGANDPEKDSLDRKIMELAISMAKLERSLLHVVHAMEFHRLPTGSSADVWKRLEATAEHEVEKRLYGFLEGFDIDAEVRIHLVSGKPAQAISELANKERIDLLVMGTVCRTGVRGFFVGNTAEDVLRKVDCSVLTVKPAGFVSPI